MYLSVNRRVALLCVLFATLRHAAGQGNTAVIAVYLPTTSFDEDDGIAQVCIALISRSPAGVILQAPSAVAPTFIDGTATSASDYSQVATPASVQFDAGLFVSGSTPTGSECFTFPLINDDVVEGLETVLLGLGATTGLIEVDNTRADSQAIVFINDDDEALFSLDMAAYSITESGGFQRVFAQIVNGVFLSTNVEVTVRTLPADPLSAVVPGDYVSRSMTYTFQPGNQGPMFLDIPIANDDIPEPNESFQVELTIEPAFTNFASRVNPFLSPVLIIEDGDDILFTLSLGSDQVGEAGGNAEAIVTPMGPVPLQLVLFVSTVSGTATANADFTSLTIPLIFNPGSGPMSVNIPIIDDDFIEGNENFFVILFSNDPGVLISGSPASVTIIDSDVAVIALTHVEPNMPVDGGYQITECVDENLYFYIAIINGVGKGPNVRCEITVRTEDGTALAGSDYTALNSVCIIDSTTSQCEFHLDITDDFAEELDESFNVILESRDPSIIVIVDNNITFYIIDDEDCDDGVCEDNEICDELMCPNNFTCTPIPEGVGDDPHFAVTLASGRTLCYTVQGEHGFAFNLISNKKLYMNAMFVPDALREEVTWLGTMGIVVNNNGYKKSNMTRLRFEAIKNKIHIDDQMVLEARNIEKITIENGKLTISEAPPVEGYKQPFVRVDLRDVELSFSVKFMTEHLDLYWHTTGHKTEDSHGLIGQFFHRDVVLDDVRKILMIPGKEPVPVQRKPVWAFMEREAGDSTNFCWVAMNPGYQGEGLIDGTYFDYLVDDVLSTEFKFKKL